MAKKVTKGTLDSKADQVVNQVVEQVTADNLTISSKDSEITVKCNDAGYIALIAYNNKGNLISFPSHRVIKGSAVGQIIVGSTEQAKVFKTDNSGVLKLDVRTTGRTTIDVMFYQKNASAVI